MSSEEYEKLLLLLKSYNSFGVNLFKSIVLPDKNAFISPLGLALTFALLINGAGGKTKESLLQALMIKDIDQEEFNTLNLEIIKESSRSREPVHIDIAISFWFSSNIDVTEAFKNIAKEFFHSEIRTVDFEDNSTYDLMNKWVQEKTHGLITKIADSEVAPSSPTAFFILNVIYFKGLWIKQFDQKNTQPETFFLENGNQKTVPMMHQEDTFLYVKTNEVEVVQMMYGKGYYGSTNAFIFLPVQSGSLTEFVRTFDYLTLIKLIKSVDTHHGTLKIPRFSFEYKIDLTQALKNQGMGKIFDSNANFLSMSIQNPYIEKILQKTSIVFNEKGTEIATLTQTRGIMGDPPALSMIVNRPFLVVIIDSLMLQRILFIGCVYDP